MITEERALQLMREAIEESKLSKAEDGDPHPKVGAILASTDGTILIRAHRGETGKGDHAEYLLLEKAALAGVNPFDTTLFVTLEPCVARGPNKLACFERVLQSGISRIYIGSLDPNPQIFGRGEMYLTWSKNIEVERFPARLKKEIESLNEEVIEFYRQAHLPTSSLHVTTQITELVRSYLKKAGLDIDDLHFNWDLTIDDLINYCGFSHEAGTDKLVKRARAEAYDKKYADYSYDSDTRGLTNDWQQQCRSILTALGASDYNTRRVINVGIGNGLEAEGIFDEVEHLIAADIAPKSLEAAQARLPGARIVLAEAEDLQAVPTTSQDIYISLRTYQSTYFNVSRAIREIRRVLRPGGVVVISIANGYVGRGGVLIPGLLVPKTNVVDRDRPFFLAERIRQKLTMLRFEELGIRTGLAEIYVFGRRSR